MPVSSPELAKLGLSFIRPWHDNYSTHAGFGGRNSGLLLEMLYGIYGKYPADFVLLHAGHRLEALEQLIHAD